MGKFISSKVLRLWNFAKNDHKNVKLASLRQCHFYAQRKIPEPKYFHELLQASPSRIHPPRLQPFPHTHSPTLENECSLAAPLHKHLQSFHIFLSLSHVFQRGRQGGARGGTAAFATVSEFPLGFFPICQMTGLRAVPGPATVSEFPLGFFSHLPNSGTPGSTRPCNCERVPPRMVFIFAKYKKVY